MPIRTTNSEVPKLNVPRSDTRPSAPANTPRADPAPAKKGWAAGSSDPESTVRKKTSDGFAAVVSSAGALPLAEIKDPALRKAASTLIDRPGEDGKRDGVVTKEDLDFAVRKADPALMRPLAKVFGSDAVVGLKTGADLQRLLKSSAVAGPGAVADTGPTVRYDKLFEGPKSTWVVAFGQDDHAKVSPDIGLYGGFKSEMKKLGFELKDKRTAVDCAISDLGVKGSSRELIDGLKFKPAQQAQAKAILAGIEKLGASAVDPTNKNDPTQVAGLNARFDADVGKLRSSLAELAKGIDNPRVKAGAEKLGQDLTLVSEAHARGTPQTQDQRGYTVYSRTIKAPDGHPHELTVKLFNSSQFKNAAEEYTRTGPEERGKFSLSHAGGGNGLKIGGESIRPEAMIDGSAPMLLMAPIACRSFEHYGPGVEQWMKDHNIAKEKFAFFGTSKEVEMTQEFGANNVLKDVLRSTLDMKGGATMLKSAEAAYSPILGTYDTDQSIKSDGLIHKKTAVLEGLIDGTTMRLPG